MLSTGVGGSVAWLPSTITGFLARLTSSRHFWIWHASKKMFKSAVNLQWPEHLRIDEHLLQDLPDCLWLEGCEREVETFPWAPRLQQRDS